MKLLHRGKYTLTQQLFILIPGGKNQQKNPTLPEIDVCDVYLEDA